MLVVIYETKFTSPFSLLVSLVTGSGYSHGAILNNGVLYDTTLSRGRFGKANNIDPDRKVAVIKVQGDCQPWIDANMGAPYDFIGLLLWFARISVVGSKYCFNIIEESADSLDAYLELGWRKDGGSIIDSFLRMDYDVSLMKGGKFNEIYLKKDTL